MSKKKIQVFLRKTHELLRYRRQRAGHMNRDEEKLVKKIVGFLCRKYHIPTHDMETRQDMFHDGIIGLMDAKRKYDPDMQVPFKAYAGIRIHGAVVDAMRKKPAIRLPQEKQTRVKALLDARNLLAARGQEPSDDSLCRHLGWTKETLRQVESLLIRVQSSDDTALLTVLPAPKAGNTDPEKQVLQKDLARVMQKCLDGLADAADRLILVARQLENVTLRQLAEQFSCSIEKIRQTEIKAKARMRACLEKHDWDLQ
jgi:RNA polymerase sigma factor FliA